MRPVERAARSTVILSLEGKVDPERRRLVDLMRDDGRSAVQESFFWKKMMLSARGCPHQDSTAAALQAQFGRAHDAEKHV